MSIHIKEMDPIALLHGLKNPKIPYFQREYTWDKNQVEEFIKDIVESKTENYYIGSIVIKNEGDAQLILDGQQRISTLILLINSLSRIEEINVNEDLKEINSHLVKRFNFESANIKDGKILNNIIKEDHNNLCLEDKESTYYKNFSTISKLLDSLKEKNNKKDYSFIFEKISNVKISYVIVDNEVDENLLFEKINSTGKQLSQYDLVKNFLFAKIFKEYQNKKIQILTRKLKNV